MAAPGPASVATSYSVRRFFAMLLMATGGLIAGLSGLCSAAVLVTVLVPLAVGGAGGGGLGGFINLVGMILVFGGIPFAIGAGLFVLGRNLLRPRTPASPVVAKTFE